MLCRVVAKRQRDEAVVAGGIEVELQLGAPKPAVPHQRSLRRALPTLAAVQRLVQLRQASEAGRQHALVRGVAVVGPMQQRHMSGLADQHAKAHHAQVLSLALGMTALGELTRRQ